MKISEFEKLKELIRNYIQLLEKEYFAISEILSFNMDSFSDWEQMRMWYIQRLEQIRELVDRNRYFLESVEHIESALSCTSSGPDSIYSGEHFSDVEQRIQEKENFVSMLDALEVIDDEDVSAIADAIAALRAQSADGGETMVTADGKLAGGHGMCRICGNVFNQVTNYCPECGTKVIIEKPAVTLDKVRFSAVAPKTFVKGDYSVIEILMYEETFRHVVQEAIDNVDDPVKETKSGFLTAEREAKITVMISSPDFEIEDNTESQIWKGGYLSFSFAVEVPEQHKKRQILFVASVYINDIIATRLKFVAKCKSLIEQKIEVTREDVLSAFVSYASQDRNRVAMIIQGMKKARPDMDIFFDVDSLRSGDDWEKALWREIDKRDVLFLCWSKYARDSKWVDAEWRYAFKNKGPDSIEPVPIDPPGSCPPPDELSRKHFNDKLLYIINSYSSTTNDALTVENMDEWW